MKILKKSKSLKTKMNQKWLDNAGINHFWMAWRFNFLMNLIKSKKIKLNKKSKVMDLGCGNGILSNQLESKMKIKIDRVDSNFETLKLNKNVNGRLICYNISEKNKKYKNFYDIIFLFDVIEHVKNDNKFLSDALFHLKKNGILIINVPSLQVLYSKYDRAVGHLRRYDKKLFKKLIKKISSKSISMNYWGFCLLPLLLLRKMILIFYGKHSHNKIVKSGWETNNFINFFMKNIMRIELKLLKNQLLGSSLMVILTK